MAVDVGEMEYTPRLIAWEVTRRCNMNCRHCRAGACNIEYPGELTTAECKKTLDNIASFSRPIIILTGGEPMMRNDIFELAAYGKSLGLRMVMAPCGHYVNDDTVVQMIAAGIECISLSIDSSNAAGHDSFRGTPGAFEMVLNAAGAARAGGLEFQVNTTVTRENINELADIMELARVLGAVTFNPFLLVPTGRGQELAGSELSPQQYEKTLQWLSDVDGGNMAIRVTCGPQYQRIIRQKGEVNCGHGGGKVFGAGCMGGKSFAFISHVGSVQICGFLEHSAGSLKENDFDFADIWKNSDFLKQIRIVDGYKGKCGTCQFRKVCGGCRARAYAATGDFLDSEPMCEFGN